MQIYLAILRSARGASHQPAFMGSCLSISHTCLPCLPSRSVIPGILYHIMIVFFYIHNLHVFKQKNIVTRYLYIWTYLESQSRSHYKIVDRATKCMKFFDQKTFTNKQKG